MKIRRKMHLNKNTIAILALSLVAVFIAKTITAAFASSVSWSGATEITSATTQSNQVYTSTTSDENALLINTSSAVTIENPTVTKSGGPSGHAGDEYSFYGINSGIMVKGGGTTTITGGTITTSATGANGVFSYGNSTSSGDGTTVKIYDTSITTTGSGSGGIMTTYQGKTYAYDLTVNTSGGSSAAIRTDRGGGTVVVDGGTYVATGSGSPAIYSTADVTVSNATLKSGVAEGIVVEGRNSVTIDNCTVYASNTTHNSSNSSTYKGIFLYQSQSGDAASGTSSFSATDSGIENVKGDVFFVTNNTATIDLENTEIINDDSTGAFLRIEAAGWGTSGSNGGDVTLTGTNQDITGDIYVDDISTLIMSLSSGSNYSGAINADNTAESISLTLDSTSTITLTADSYISSLSNTGVTNNSNINLNGYTLYVGSTAITSTDYSEDDSTLGDVDDDSSITLLDALYIARSKLSDTDTNYYALSSSALLVADVDSDGSVTLIDALYIARSLLDSSDGNYKKIGS